MRKKSLWSRPVFGGVTIGGSGGGQPVPLVILTVVVTVMALITVYKRVSSTMGGGIDWSKINVVYKCLNPECGFSKEYHGKEIMELQTTPPPDQPPPPMPAEIMFPTIQCPKCGKYTFAEAVKCKKCGEIFVMKMDPKTGVPLDKCPKCGTKQYEDQPGAPGAGPPVGPPPPPPPPPAK